MKNALVAREFHFYFAHAVRIDRWARPLTLWQNEEDRAMTAWIARQKSKAKWLSDFCARQISFVLRFFPRSCVWRGKRFDSHFIPLGKSSAGPWNGLTTRLNQIRQDISLRLVCYPANLEKSGRTHVNFVF